ncbi:MAG TPA: hypothetical protein VMS77_04330 [Conexivisphaerales archaeon]|nr:hypothetical protein [Conexivisphaerales archaeon]
MSRATAEMLKTNSILVAVVSCLLTFLALGTGMNLFANVLPNAQGLGIYAGEVTALFIAFLGGAILGWSYLYRKARSKLK